MATYKVKSHPVTGTRISRTEPICDQGKMVAPNAGLMLIMEDGSSEKWVADRFGAVPNIGDFLVRDPELRITAVVSASQFSELFEAA